MAGETALDVDEYRKFLPPEGLTPGVSQLPPDIQPYSGPEYGGASPPPSTTAMQVAPQPTGTQPGGPQVQGPPATPNQDADEDTRFNMAEEVEKNRYAVPRSHLGENEILQPKMEHPELFNLQKAQGLLQVLAQKNPAEYKLAKPVVDRMETRIRRDIDTNHKAEVARLRDEQLKSVVRYQNSGERIKTADDVDKAIKTVFDNTTARTSTGDDASRLAAGYTLETSPLKTMKDPDGTYRGLRDMVANVIALNPGMMVDTATNQVLKIASPVGTNPDGSPGRGYNGHLGKGAAYYDVIGHDTNGNYVLRTSDGGKMIMDTTSFNRAKLARTAGYQLMTAWEKKQHDLALEKQKPDWIQRNITPLIPKKGFFQ